jgi:hypothetical protein
MSVFLARFIDFELSSLLPYHVDKIFGTFSYSYTTSLGI